MLKSLLMTGCVALLSLPGVAAAQTSAAPAPSHPVAYDTYHGVRVADPQRWLEDGKDPAVRQWVAAPHMGRIFLTKYSSMRVS